MSDDLNDQLENINTAELCGVYVTLRDRKKQEEQKLNDRMAKLTATMAAIEAKLLHRLQEQNIDSVATPHGTAYRSTKVNYSVQDRAAFVAWARQHEADHLLDIRAAKAAVDEVVNETGALPDGLKRSAIFKIGIRRSTNT